MTMIGQTPDGVNKIVQVTDSGQVCVTLDAEVGGALTLAVEAVNATTSSAIVVAADADRRLLLLQNVSDTDIWVNIAAAAVVGACLLIKAAGGTLTLDRDGAAQQVRAIHAGSGNKALAIVKGA